MNEKITVIIPVYNVEKYLRKCLNSVLTQTYTNLEVILVDDGSPDNCPAICDEYAAQDERVRVIHQMNAGVSAARNAGLDAATGDYVGFVDSDDWIEPDMYETLCRLATESNADMAYVDYVVDRVNVPSEREYSEKTVLLSKEETLRAIFAGVTLNGMVSLYIARRELFSGVRFALDITVAEDILVAVQLVLQANHVAYRSHLCYHYVMHGAAAHNSFKPSYWTCFAAYDLMEEQLTSKMPDLLDDFYAEYCVRKLINSTMTAFSQGKLDYSTYCLIRERLKKYCTKAVMARARARKKIMVCCFMAGYRPFKLFARAVMLLKLYEID